jgi:glycerol-3-phosphate dehydrogenase
MEHTEEQRTLQQNKALHLFFEQVAEALNNAGLDMRKVMKPTFDIPWMKETVKEYLWKTVQDWQLGKKSTTELTKQEIDVVYETLNQHLAKLGVHVPFPSLESEEER